MLLSQCFNNCNSLDHQITPDYIGEVTAPYAGFDLTSSHVSGVILYKSSSWRWLVFISVVRVLCQREVTSSGPSHLLFCVLCVSNTCFCVSVCVCIIISYQPSCSVSSSPRWRSSPTILFCFRVPSLKHLAE